MFDGFGEFDIPTAQTTIHGVRGGAGPPVLLLHGIPETHLMCHRVAPALAERFIVVVTDLPRVRRERKAVEHARHAPYRMRAIAQDQVEVMASLGVDRFAIVGHDRGAPGARTGWRSTTPPRSAVSRCSTSPPPARRFARADRDFSPSYWVWSFLAVDGDPVNAASDLADAVTLRSEQRGVLAFAERQVSARRRRRKIGVHAAGVTEPPIPDGG